jgi:glycosyltransferase involved in cell wall biosynthesis
MSPPTVSVIIPCFNQARFLGDCLASLQGQTYPHWQAIIVNDGSTDDTEAVARRHVVGDARFTYFAQTNRGLANARNRGLREALGDYIQFLDADDVIRPEKFDLQVKALRDASDLALAFCDYSFCAENDVNRATTLEGFGKPRFLMRRPLEDIASRWETAFSIPVHCFLFGARLFRQAGIHFDERLPNHEDWDCWMRLFALNPRIVHVPSELAVYRVHAESMCRDIRQMRRGFLAALETQIELWQRDPVLVQLLEQKRIEMDAEYSKQLQAQRRARWRRRVPWRVQRIIGRLRRIARSPSGP